MLIVCQKLHICTYDRPLQRALASPLPPSGGARTARARDGGFSVMVMMLVL